jgi:hypothetical protein
MPKADGSRSGRKEYGISGLDIVEKAIPKSFGGQTVQLSMTLTVISRKNHQEIKLSQIKTF